MAIVFSGALHVGSVPWSNLALRSRVNVGDSVPCSTTSGAMSVGVTLAARGRVNVGDNVPWSTTSGSVSHGVT